MPRTTAVEALHVDVLEGAVQHGKLVHVLGSEGHGLKEEISLNGTDIFVILQSVS